MKRRDHEIYCNCCGKEIVTDDYKERDEYLDIIKEWGYFSHNKDGQIHHFHLCEFCYDRWIKEFQIPVTITEQTEML